MATQSKETNKTDNLTNNQTINQQETMNNQTNNQQQQMNNNNAANSESTEQTNLSESRIVDCQDRDKRFSYSQRGSYWILNHYIPSERNYHCDESVTYTTHGDVSFLDNIVPLARRWDGPLSVAVYTPGSDYEVAVQSIAYLRQCTEPDIRQKVTFHLVLDERHFPSSLRKVSTFSI